MIGPDTDRAAADYALALQAWRRRCDAWMSDLLATSPDVERGLRELVAAAVVPAGHRIVSAKLMLLPYFVSASAPDSYRRITVGGADCTWLRDVTTAPGVLASAAGYFQTIEDDESGLDAARALQELLDVCRIDMPTPPATNRPQVVSMDEPQRGSQEAYTVAHLIADLDDGTLAMTLSSPIGYQLAVSVPLCWEDRDPA